MDFRNLFLTPTTYRLIRLEYGAALLALIILLVAHLDEVRWWAFVGLFAYIDVIGYLPGAIAWRRAGGGRISRHYYVLYNSMHSLLSAGTVAMAWSLLVRPEWALLALPIHLCGDRAIFGNFLKPFGLSFEPRIHPAYQELVNRYAQPARPEPGRDNRNLAHLT